MAKNKRRRRKGPSKRGSIIALCIVLLLTIFVGYLGFNGLWLDGRGLWKLLPWLPTADTANWPKPLTLGLDLRGGVYIEYEATAPEGSESDFSTLMDGTVKVIQNRLTGAGYSEATVQTINNGTGIRAEIPSVTDPEAIVQLVGKTAVLSFRDADGHEFMTGKNVKSATAAYDSQEGKGYYIALDLDSEGADLFGAATAAAALKKSTGQNQISIYLDNELLMNPSADSAIYGGNIAITGGFTQEVAREYAIQIQSGALPLNLKELNHSTVSATLGDNALSGAVTAAFIGILLIMAFMILRYRLNGVVASWALCIYIIVLFFLIALFRIQLTLPGLAGVVLGIGMAVDANVIIFERFNEEARKGRSAKAAVKAGFKNAMSAVLDANVTTVIAAIVLLIFGTGSIQGFARTLLLGVIVSMLSAILITRFLMNRFVNAGFTGINLYTKVKAEKEGEQ